MGLRVKRLVVQVLLIVGGTIAVGCSSTHTTNAAKEQELAEARVAAEHMLTGYWYAELKAEIGETQRWLVERRADGFYKITTRLYGVGPSRQQVEVGEWRIEGPAVVHKIRGWIEDGQLIPVPDRDAHATKRFFIRFLSKDKFEYSSEGSDARYTVQRVTSGFRLP